MSNNSASSSDTATFKSASQLVQPDLPPPALPRMLSIVEVAQVFGRQPRTVRWWIASGRIAVVRIGRTPFVSEAELRRLTEPEHQNETVEIQRVISVQAKGSQSTE
jgi:hypothetical protein